MCAVERICKDSSQPRMVCPMAYDFECGSIPRDKGRARSWQLRAKYEISRRASVKQHSLLLGGGEWR